MDKNRYIILYENCQLTKGFNRTLIADLQRHQLDFIDNKLFSILDTESRTKTINAILKEFNSSEQNIILEYFEFLLEKEYAFLCSKSELSYFPKLSLEWDNPSFITNCIIDLNSEYKISNYEKVILDLNELACEDIQLRDFNGISINYLKSLLQKFSSTTLIRIELIVKKIEHFNVYKKLVKEFPRISSLVLHTANYDKNYTISYHQSIACRKKIIYNENDCGIVIANYFNLRIEHYLESHHYNTCLNRKVSIDKEGNIKNCPALKTIYGNICDTSILEIVNKKEFQKIWSIKKDNINTCKDCEFRHVCTDCRAFLDSDLSITKPNKCKYNPYE